MVYTQFMTSNASLVGAAMLLVVLLAAYGYVTLRPYQAPEAVQIGNPAAVHCVSVGGSLEVREDAQGAQAGFCIFEDGRVCEEWALFRDDSCVPPQS